MRTRKAAVLILAVMLFISGCTQGKDNSASNENTDSGTDSGETAAAGAVDTQGYTTDGMEVNLTGTYSAKALDASYEETDACKITLKDTEAEIDGSGAKTDGDIITITEQGTYLVSGNLKDGQLVVDLTEDKNVHLVLDNAQIQCSDSAAIWVKSVKNLYLTLAEGSSNTIADGSTYSSEAEAEGVNAAIYSKDDLIINGTGSLTVNANYKDGITGKDDLTIVEGVITVNAADDALVGKDSITVRNGTLNLTAGGDAMKSSNIQDSAKGCIIIDGGEFVVNAGDDGVHSETVLAVNGGNIDIESCVEGLESLNIIIKAGTVSVVSSDDGINVSGGNDTVSEDSPMMGKGGSMDAVLDGALVICGGTLLVDAGGDGLDSNGNIRMTGGYTEVSGPEDAGNGALDYNGVFNLTGGTLLVSGTTGMVQTPSEESGQIYMAAVFDDYVEAGTKVAVTDADGKERYSFTAVKRSNMILVSGPALIEGDEYTVTAGEESCTITGGESQITDSMGGGMKGKGGVPPDGSAMPEGGTQPDGTGKKRKAKQEKGTASDRTTEQKDAPEQQEKTI